MCTVSFVRNKNRTIITSNRDERVVRQAAEPQNYLINNKSIVFPKDPKAGGTWYAVDEHANVVVLLNGASEKHAWKPPYRKSRGLIVLDIISAKSPFLEWHKIDLDDIEPFTLVLFENQELLFQLRWNGTEKETVKLNPAQSHIWSSTMLYPREVREKRARWFRDFMHENPQPSPKDLLNFHCYSDPHNTEEGLVIDRNFLKTVSITQTILEDSKVSMIHHDLISNEEFPHSFIISK